MLGKCLLPSFYEQEEAFSVVPVKEISVSVKEISVPVKEISTLILKGYLKNYINASESTT